jgi:hypothetical protein
MLAVGRMLTLCVQTYTRRDYQNEIKHLQSSTASWYLAIFNTGLEEQVCSSISSEASSASDDDTAVEAEPQRGAVRCRYWFSYRTVG